LSQFDKKADAIRKRCQRCDSFATQIKTGGSVGALVQFTDAFELSLDSLSDPSEAVLLKCGQHH